MQPIKSKEWSKRKKNNCPNDLTKEKIEKEVKRRANIPTEGLATETALRRNIFFGTQLFAQRTTLAERQNVDKES